MSDKLDYQRLISMCSNCRDKQRMVRSGFCSTACTIDNYFGIMYYESFKVGLIEFINLVEDIYDENDPILIQVKALVRLSK